jgi:tetratricopeptide (TPR) repeat protein
VIWGTGWALIAWTPLLMPSLGWHAYYAMFGMLGAWMALSALLTRRPVIALAVVAALAIVRAGRANTESSDWGNEWFQRRAALFGRETRDWFRSRYPTLPHHTRIFLSKVPAGVGLVPGSDDAATFRVWYGDPTLGTYFGSHYRPRRAGEPAGQDYLFTYDSTAGWQRDTIVELHGAPSQSERLAYAEFMWKVGRFADAQAQYEKLVTLAPDRWDYVFDLGSCIMRQGDSTTAARWYQRAAAMPGFPDEMRPTAERARRFLK